MNSYEKNDVASVLYEESCGDSFYNLQFVENVLD